MPWPPDLPDDTALNLIPWGQFKAYFTPYLTRIADALDSSYGGVEMPVGNLPGTTHHLERLRELFTLGSAGGDSALMTALRPRQRLVMEYQTKQDINGDGKIYGWDYVHVDDLSDNPLIIQPEPMIRGIADTPDVRNRINGGLVELVPGDMPPSGMYPPGVRWSIHGSAKFALINAPFPVPLPNVNMSMTGSATFTTVTGYDGYYFFAGLSDGTYTITPSLTGYTFAPTSIIVNVSGAIVIDQSFIATQV
jgi:hypothetical protein